MSTRYVIVQVDPRTHRGEALGLLTRNFPASAETWLERYEKLYERNPAGEPLLFFARDQRSESFVGMTTVFPTTLRIDGEPVRGGIPGDFAVDRAHRGFGPAVALQRASMTALVPSGLQFAYGCPNSNSDPVTTRAGFRAVGALTRFVKILKSKVVIDRYLRPGAGARFAATIAPYAVDPVLSVMSRERIAGRARELSFERPDRFDERFDAVLEVGWKQHRVILERTPVLLNWKFDLAGSRQAEGAYRILALAEADEPVVAYAVCRTVGGIRHVEDIGCFPSKDILDALIAELVRDARAEGIEAIGLLYVGPRTLLTQRLRAFGFRPRPEEPRLRVFVPEGASVAVDLLSKENWFFLGGDTDI